MHGGLTHDNTIRDVNANSPLCLCSIQRVVAPEYLRVDVLLLCVDVLGRVERL